MPDPHGHVYPRLDGVKKKCGGPGTCIDCSVELVCKLHADEEAKRKQKKSV